MNRIQGLTAALLLCGAASTLAQTNLLNNPGFESGGTGWTLWTQSGSPAVAAVTYPSTGAHGGTRHARVTVTTPAASASENWHVQFQPPTNWTAQNRGTYEFKFWAKSDSSRPIHVSVQGGDYTYLTGTSFGLTPDWTEYSLIHVSEADGASAVRFHVYVAEAVGTYDFDDFSVLETPPAGIAGGLAAGKSLQVRQEAGHLVVSLGGVSGNLKAELLDLRGVTVASATGEGSLRFATPRSGAYFVRANAGTKAWVRKVVVP